MNSKHKCLKKTESLPVELGLVSLHDALLSRRRDSRVLESTLNDVSTATNNNKSLILDQENGYYGDNSTSLSICTSTPTPTTTPLVHHTLSPTTPAPLACNKALMVSIGTQTHSCHSCTNETGPVEHSLLCCSAISSSTRLTTTSVANDRQRKNVSPPLSPHFI
jgi:hypothetical protein